MAATAELVHVEVRPTLGLRRSPSSAAMRLFNPAMRCAHNRRIGTRARAWPTQLRHRAYSICLEWLPGGPVEPVMLHDKLTCRRRSFRVSVIGS